ncbi:NAC domain-containing protein [Abeliophyllum distichum]|uniref:NAC domain-containing protein n=1 Tax=Abeliophyllum distichum TaxID=126358 RepID=A0ABD1PNX6_9LAMI
MAGVPAVGCRFQPTDFELRCLLCKAYGKPLPSVDLDRECDIYGGVEPMELFRGTDDKDLYFFTQLKKKNTVAGKPADRTSGKGIWKAVNKKDVYDVKGIHRGFKKTFVYETVEKVKNGYIMDEYSLDSYYFLRAKIQQKPQSCRRAFTDQQPEVVIALPAQIAQQNLLKFKQKRNIIMPCTAPESGAYSQQNMDSCDGSYYTDFAKNFARDLMTQNPQQLEDEQVLMPNPWAVKMRDY